MISGHPRRLTKLLVAATVLIASTLVLESPTTTTPAAAATPGPKTVIANLFEWNWASVAAECTSFFGPRGYGYVQVSPPQEHVRGQQWWVSYEPVSYRIESRRGTRAQFQSMVNTCHAAGV